jgi:cation:H+ antiporter
VTEAILLVVGGFCLYIGAEWLVRGSSGLALSFGVRPLVVGLTVVAYGTSMPELVVGVGAALSHKGAIALGNSVGSNVANLGLILGITALIAPPKIDPAIRRRELPVLVMATLAIPMVLLDGRLSRFEAVLLLGGALSYSILLLWNAKADPEAARDAQEMAEAAGAPKARGPWALSAIAAVGLIILLAGGKLFVDGASGIARTLGMSDRLVGLTVVAVGTSLPELATSIIAARRGQSEVALGNLLGSNIFNALLILGAVGVAGTLEQPIREVAADLVALCVITGLGVVALLRPRVSRAMGAVLLVGYATFIVQAILWPGAPG